MGDHGREYNLDEALSGIGFGKFQVLAVIFAGLGWFLDAMEMMLLSFIGPAVQSEWKLSPTEESLLTTAVFIGILVGAYIWGLISDIFGRRTGNRSIAIVTAGAGLLSAFSPDYKTLIMLRCLLGFGLGGLHAFVTWFLEFVPTCNRGSWMVAVHGFWSLGSLFSALLAWIVMPRLGWRWLLALSSIPSFLVLVFSNFIPESPRYLCLKGGTVEALGVLEKVALINRTQLPSDTLVFSQKTDIHEADNPSEDGPLLSSIHNKTTYCNKWVESSMELFSSNLLRTTLLLWLLFFGYAFVYYGIVLMISKLTGGHGECGSRIIHSKYVKDSSLYRDSFIVSLSEVPALVFVAVMVDCTGRKPSLAVSFLLSFIVLLPLLSYQDELRRTASLFAARFFIYAASTTAGIYAKEVYPTSVRTTGVGVAVSVGRIAGMICPLVAVGLIRNCHQTAAIIVFEIVTLFSGLSVLFLPIETKGRSLTDIERVE